MSNKASMLIQFIPEIYMYTSMASYTTAIRCEGFYKGCCPGSLWNTKTQQCESCMPGYNGINCTSLCPYPLYGVDCQRSCNCSKDLCNVSTGCIYPTTASERCSPGYFGKNCRAKCMYPYFGKECRERCDCGENFCDVSTGCFADTTDTVKADCSPGYFGKNCREKCSYPYYGEECQGQCDCDEERCDATIGCTNATKDIQKLLFRFLMELKKKHYIYIPRSIEK